MAVPSESWNTINDTQTDADSPLDTVLMEAIRQNLIHLEEWLGDGYTAAKDHDHDNVNSKTVALGDRTIAAVKIVANSLTASEIAADAIYSSELRVGAGAWSYTSYAIPALTVYYPPQKLIRNPTVIAGTVSALNKYSRGAWRGIIDHEWLPSSGSWVTVTGGVAGGTLEWDYLT